MISTNVVVIMPFTSKNSTVLEACLIERIFVFKRMPKERQLRVRHIYKILSLTGLKRSPDLLNNVKIGQDQLQLKMKHILFYGGCGHFGQVT